MSLLKRPLLVLDTETSGLPRAPWSRVIEVAIVALDIDGVEVSSYECLVRPGELPGEADEALALTGISREALEMAPSAMSVATELAYWLGSRKFNDWTLTSFNVDFDRTMLRRDTAWSRWTEAPWAACIMRAAHRVMGQDPACTLQRWDNGEMKWPKLSEAAAYFGVEVCEPQHRALGDARTAAGVIRAIAGRKP